MPIARTTRNPVGNQVTHARLCLINGIGKIAITEDNAKERMPSKIQYAGIVPHVSVQATTELRIGLHSRHRTSKPAPNDTRVTTKNQHVHILTRSVPKYCRY